MEFHNLIREVTTEEGKQFTQEHHLEFFETSAKEGTNVEAVFTKITEVMLKKAIEAETHL